MSTEPSGVSMSVETLQMYDRRVIARSEGGGVVYDGLGRQHFRRMGMPLILAAIPALAQHFSRVPDEFWALDADEQGVSRTQVTCPCGHIHEVEVGQLLEADCERFFYALGEALLVANSPAPA